MEPDQLLTEIVTMMKATKEEWVASRPDNVDLSIYLHFFRDQALAISAQTVLDRDVALKATTLGIMGFDADAVAITSEAYHTKLELSPLTGEPWQHQEMQYVVETMGEKGWAYECLTTMLIQKSGQCLVHMSSYQIKDHQVHWTADDRLGEADGTAGGVIPETVRQAFTRPQLSEHLASLDDDDIVTEVVKELGAERARFHSDMATWRALKEQKLVTAVVMSAEKDSLRYQLLTERLGEPDTQW